MTKKSCKLPDMDLRCEAVNFEYKEKVILKNFNFALGSGDKVWIRGPSGSGKSTFLKLVAGFLEPVSGQVKWAGQSITRERRLKHIGFMDQECHLIDHWTVEQNLKLVNGKSDLLKWIKDFGLDPEHLNEKAAHLSGGERQRISLIRLMLQKPGVALLDEPTAHLDDQAVSKVIGLIEQHLKSSTLIVVSHDSRIGAMNLKAIDFKAGGR